MDRLKVRVGLHWPGDLASLEAELRRIDLLGPGSNWVTATTVSAVKSGSWMDSVISFAGSQARAREALPCPAVWGRPASWPRATGSAPPAPTGS